jgi:two-component system, chemotaxis family, protein-glutamate methylesterase/glutaminase
MPTGDGDPAIALVCSAGGLHALTRVLEPLPADLPAAIIVLRHVSPEYISELAGILAGRCRLRVVTASHGDRVQRGTVYVAPAARHTLVTPERTLALVESGAYPPYRPSADLLLSSLALGYRDRAIAVVLSGKGVDGATGVSVVHGFGGTVIAADRASSEHFSMPEAAIGRHDAVDYVLPVERIPAVLQQLVSEAGPTAGVRWVAR